MKWAIVTGASAGFGVEFVKLCADDGYSVVLVARRKDRLEKLADELAKKYPEQKFVALEQNLANPSSPKDLHKKVSALTGDVEVLINNAGFGAGGAFPAPDLDRNLEMIDLNVRALAELTGLFLPQMVERKSGKILNVGSSAGFQPGPYMSTYYASKAFVNSFSEALHEELKPKGVTCTVLTPGPVSTEFGMVAKVSLTKAGHMDRVSNLTAEDVARAGYRGMMNGQAMVVPGLTIKMLPQLARVLPRSAVRKLAGWINRRAQ